MAKVWPKLSVYLPIEFKQMMYFLFHLKFYCPTESDHQGWLSQAPSKAYLTTSGKLRTIVFQFLLRFYTHITKELCILNRLWFSGISWLTNWCYCVIFISFDWKSCQSTDWRKLSNPKVWVDAAEQVFFTITIQKTTSDKKQKVENKNLVYHTYIFWTCK